MTNDAVLELPRYYLTRDTPDGVLLLYPLDAIEGAEPERYSRPADTDGPHSRKGWAFEVTVPDAVTWTFTKHYLVADAPIGILRRTRPGPRQADGMIKRDEPYSITDEPVSPDLRAAYDESPERPTQADVGHYAEHDAAHVCWRCRVYVATYRQHYVPGPEVVEVQQFDGWRALPGGEAPESGDRTWTVTEPGYLTLYGRHTAHLWPGALSGLRDAVVEALRAHPHVTEVNVWSHKQNEVSVRIQVGFEPPRSRTRQVKETPRSRTRMRTVHETVYGIDKSVRDVRVPDLLAADCKADALARWDATVAEQVARFVPHEPNSAVCGTCEGLGMVQRA